MKITADKLTRFFTDPDYARMVVRTNSERVLENRRRRKGIAPPPQGVTVFLTDRCNLRCRFCSQWGEKGVNIDRAPQIMPREVFSALVEQLSGWKPMLFLMGGEPFLYKDLFWAIEKTASAGMESFIITNGTLLEAKARQVVDSGLTVLSISLDGPKAVHDQIRGEGVYDKIMAGIRALDAAKKEQGSHHPEIHIAATISQESYRHLPQLAEELRNLPIGRLTIQHLYFMTGRQMHRQNDMMEQLFGIRSENIEGLEQEPGEFDLPELKKVLKTLKETEYPFPVGFAPSHPLDDLESYYGDPEAYVRRRPERCGHIWRMTSVYADGEITPCMNFGAGKVTEKPFKKIWNSKEYRRFRRILDRNGYLPACHRCCNE